MKARHPKPLPMIKTMIKTGTILYFFSALLSGAFSLFAEPKAVILMVPDGMGLSNVTIARTYLSGKKPGRLTLETLPFIGYQSTHSRNSTVTDSAAAASAWACGEKFDNSAISCHDDDKDGKPDNTRNNALTILEIAREQGKGTGIVGTCSVTHATLAAFGSHVHHRNCAGEILEDYLKIQPDVILGGNASYNRNAPCHGKERNSPEWADNMMFENFPKAGYQVARTKEELAKTASAIAEEGKGKLLGVFSDKGGMTPVFRKPPDSPEPTLAEMTLSALKVLEKNEKGFFLLVEGSQIDWANHARNLNYQIGETLAFDAAVKVVKDWLREDVHRAKNTMLIVAPDHETGGVIIEGPYGRRSEGGVTGENYKDGFGNPVNDFLGNPTKSPDLQVTFASARSYDKQGSANHTAVDTLIWSNQPELAGPKDNTDLYQIMRDFLSSPAEPAIER